MIQNDIEQPVSSKSNFKKLEVESTISENKSNYMYM